MSNYKKNTAITGFSFTLVHKTTGVAITTGTVTGYYLLDGGTQTAIAGTPVHEGNGQWSVNIAAGEMNGDMVGLLFTHADSVPVNFAIRTTTKLISELNDVAATAIVSSGAITTSGGAVSTVTNLTNPNVPLLLQRTTIATLASQTSFTLTAGSADNAAYNRALVVVTDSVTATQKCVGVVSAYTGSTRTVTLDADPGVFTMAAGDSIDIIAAEISSINVGSDGRVTVSNDSMTEAYPVDGQSGMSVPQALYATVQLLTEFARSGTTISVKKRDGTTTAFTVALDSATDPTTATQAT